MNDCIEEILESFSSLLNPSINFLKVWKQKLREYRAPTKHIMAPGEGASHTQFAVTALRALQAHAAAVLTTLEVLNPVQRRARL